MGTTHIIPVILKRISTNRHDISLLFAGGVLIASFIAALITFAGVVVKPMLFFELIFGGLVIINAGQILLSVAGLKEVQYKLLLTILLGSILCSLVINMGTSIAGISAGMMFLILASAIIIIDIFRPQWISNCSTINLKEFLIFLIIGIFVLLWSFRIASSFPTLEASGILPAWVDYWIHGGEIAQFSDPKAIGRGAILLSDETSFFYHRGIYMLPAVVAQVAIMPGISSATAVLLPLGILLAALAIFVLGATLSNYMGGIVSLLAIGCLPDSATYGLQNGMFSFHWLTFTSPGSGYAIAACFTSIVFFVYWLRSKTMGAFILSFGLAFAVFFLRAHFFVWYLPTLLLAALFQTRFIFRFRIWFLVGSLSIIITAAILLVWSESLYNMVVNWSAVVPFLSAVHITPDPPYANIYTEFSHLHSTHSTILLGIFLLFPAILGGFFILYPVLLVTKILLFGSEWIDILPIILCIVFVGVVLFAPVSGHGDPTEYQHRPFLLVYATIIVYCSAYLTRIFPLNHWLSIGFVKTKRFVTGIVLLMVVIFNPVIDPARPNFSWGRLLYGQMVNRDVLAIANFLRVHATPGDTVAVGPLSIVGAFPNDPPYDEATIIAAISGVPVFLGRPGILRIQSHSKKLAVDQRLRVINLIQNAPTRNKALKITRLSGIDWYVSLNSPNWDINGELGIFKSQKSILYFVGSK